jgi:hypothetical protein
MAPWRSALRCLAVSPDERLTAAAGFGKEVHLWEILTGNRHSIPKIGDEIDRLPFTVDS